MRSTTKTGLALTLALLAAACGAPDTRLPGERLGLRAFDSAPDPAAIRAAQPNTARAIALPAARVNAAWTHRGGEADHFLGHVALGPTPTLAFRTPIGAGDSRRARITADPVVADGRVFTLDANATLSATAVTGEPLWAVSVARRLDAATDASGGGLAYADGVVYVTTTFGELIAIDAATGGEFWTQDLDAPGGSAPTVSGDLVYVAARNGRAWAIDRGNGRIRWTLAGTPSPDGFDGGAGAAVSGGYALFPFPSGEVVGAFAQGGIRRWSSFVAGRRLGRAGGFVTDISGDPVVADGRVYAGNVSGALDALDLETGETIWSVTEGALSPVVPVGDSVFLVNEVNQLVRLDAATGAPIWRQELPTFVEQRFSLFRKPNRLHAHYGPVLAGGRLVVASSDGLLRFFDPVSGALTGQSELPGGATTNPVVAGGVLYVVNKDGELLAFR
ncbi:putative quinoprotein [Oceanicola granulosus HTCC2516]|uniref:Putative quinoprotein n=1 Tax=Oceanicola granulosus (strain ATCC BAA-861 / DSM 15982 / KCTC 12143 / HTCC2516) TaxID=314256 RepID=Q2CHP6_OCEGH|nr:PQQ-like beta-propeller repeat protein [Oceanicola granulosus]EAR52248.1 putative quinoprotein [Oceanicola granulosus HTCC2516]